MILLITFNSFNQESFLGVFNGKTVETVIIYKKIIIYAFYFNLFNIHLSICLFIHSLIHLFDYFRFIGCTWRSFELSVKKSKIKVITMEIQSKNRQPVRSAGKRVTEVVKMMARVF